MQTYHILSYLDTRAHTHIIGDIFSIIYNIYVYTYKQIYTHT